MCPFHFDVVDYRDYLVDFKVKSIPRDLALSLRSPNERRLMYSFTIIVQRCLERVESRSNFHMIPFKINQLKD